MQQTLTPTGPSSAQREAIHDLRNLFGIVMSAKHLLERQPPEPRRGLLLDAIEDAAIRGGDLTTGLLASVHKTDNSERLELNACIRALEPMIRALTGPAIELFIDLHDASLPVRLDAVAFEAALLELVTNARVAGASAISLRTRRAGGRAWLLVADNGCGMDATKRAQLCRVEDRGEARGTGLCRVRRFILAAHGRFGIRSRAGRGTVISMNLPTVLKLAAGKPDAFPKRRIPAEKEKNRAEERQSAAA